MGPVFLLEFPDLQVSQKVVIVAQIFVQALAREGQAGEQESLQAVYRSQRGVERRRRCLPVALDLLPGFLVIEIAVRLPCQGHDPLQRSLEVAVGQALADGLEAGLNLGQKSLISLVQLARLRYPAVEAAIGEGQCPVCQIAPRGDQFVVVAAHESSPGEIRITGLWSVAGQIVAQGIGLVAIEEVVEADEPVAALGELPPLQVQILVGWHVVG